MGDRKRKDSSISGYDQFFISQYEIAWDAYRTVFSQSVNIITIIVLANITTIGYAVSERVSGIIAICIVFPLAGLALTRWVKLQHMSIAYILLSIEKRFQNSSDEDHLAKVLLSTDYKLEYVKALSEILNDTDEISRIKKLRSLRTPRGRLYSFTVVSVWIIIGIYLLATVYLVQKFGWRLF